MAYDYVVSTRASCLIGGKMYHTWTVVETDAGTADEFCLDVPEFCTLTQYQAKLVSGAGTTINPGIGLVASWSSETLDQVAANVTPGAFICNQGRVSVTATGGVLYFRSAPDSGVNVIHTRITLVEGHC